MKPKIKLACIIDDDTVYVNLVKRIIEAKQLCENLLIFENGRDALAYFATILSNMDPKKIPDIIFLDLNMPVMDGWEFLAHFTQLRNGLGKVITLYVVSSSINPLDLKKARSIKSVKEYLIKPVTISDLEDIFSPV